MRFKMGQIKAGMQVQFWIFKEQHSFKAKMLLMCAISENILNRYFILIHI